MKIQAPTAPATPAEKKAAETTKVAHDFEAIFVRQLLSHANVAGKGGYSDMATEALSTSISAAGGLGMARVLEAAFAAEKK